MNIDEQIMNAFVKSTINVMRTSCFQEEIVSIEIDENRKNRSDIIGVMGLSGNLSGAAVLTFHQSLATTLVAQMCGYDPEELNEEEISDGITEILNMICGNTKSLLSKTVNSFELSVPTVISSQEYKISHHHDMQTGVIDFQIPDGKFTLLLSLKVKETENIL